MIPRTKTENYFRDLCGAMRLNEQKPVEQLKQALSKRFGLPHPLLTACASAGLYFVLKVLTGRKIYLPAYTCRALIEACFFAGRIDDIHLVDINIDTFGMDLDELEKNVFPGSIIIATHQFGIPADMNRFRKIAEKTRSILIEDNAAAFGARFFGRETGTFGDISLFSFDYTKTFSACGGGAVFFRDSKLQIEVGRIQQGEMNSDKALLAGSLLKGLLYNVVTEENIYGHAAFPLWSSKNGLYKDNGELRKNRISVYQKPFGKVQAAIALQMLNRIDKTLYRRKQIENIYRNRLEGNPKMALYRPIAGSDTSLLMFPIRLMQGEKSLFYQQCASRGIDLGFTFSYVNKLGKQIGELEQSHLAAKMVLNLPFYSKLTDRQIDTVCKTVTEVS